MQSATTRGVIACVLLAMTAVSATTLHGRRGKPVSYAFDASAVPLEIGSYKGSDLQSNAEVISYLQAQAVLSRVYRKAGAPPVHLSVVYGTDWRTIHAPTGCYPAQGWQVQSDEALDLPAPPDCPHPGPLHARLLHATKPPLDECAIFLYAYPGGTTADWTRQGWTVATGQAGAGGLVVMVTTPIVAGDLKAAQASLSALLSSLYSPIVSFWGASQTAPKASQ